MQTLTEKLKSLGVKVGAQDLPPPQTKPARSNGRVPFGELLHTPQGETTVIDTRYPAGYQVGRIGIHLHSPRACIAAWAGEPQVGDLDPQAFAFIDTETTGLSGGAGTYAFLVGVGRFEGDEFHLAQFFMQDPAEEPAQLVALESFLAPCQAVVTFNGKAFDVPLLNARFTTHGWRTPFIEMAHVDLLHLARRLWSGRLPNRALINLEYQILGATRSEEDVPGWQIPSLYFQYLRSGDSDPLKRVIYHNAMDVVSMAALFDHMAGVLADPLGCGLEHGEDVVSLAKLFEAMGDLESATRLYLAGLKYDLPKGSLLEVIERLAAIQKRQEDWDAAVELWEQAARHGHLSAHVELAKYYEHRARNMDEAMHWTLSAMDQVRSARLPAYERRQWLDDLQHRLERCKRKLMK